jgi:hypothetical protein
MQGSTQRSDWTFLQTSTTRILLASHRFVVEPESVTITRVMSLLSFSQRYELHPACAGTIDTLP